MTMAGLRKKTQGFIARNPNKVPAKEKQTSKYDFDEMLKNDSVACLQLEALMETCEILSLIGEQEPEKMAELLQERDSYLKLVNIAEDRKINHLLLSERPQGKNLYDNLPKAFKEQLLSIKNLEEAERLLKQELNKRNLDLQISLQKKPISRDMRRVIRIEFNGGINRPNADLLSSDYAAFKDTDKETAEKSSCKADDYVLNDEVPAWKDFSSFRSFREMEDEFKEALAYNQVPPDLVKKMSVYDFEDMLFTYKQETRRRGNGRNSSYVKLFEGSKEFFLKTFYENHGDEFKEALEFMKVKPEQIKKAMESLQNGRLCPIEMADGRFIVATVHHGTAILDAAQKEDPTMVNNPDNLELMFEVLDRDRFKESVVDRSMAEENLSDISINLGKEVDIDKLARDEQLRKEFIQQTAAARLEELVAGMRKAGVLESEIINVISPMLKEGKIPSVPVGKNNYLALELRNSRDGVQLVFNSIEGSNDNPDVHKGLAHGISTKPVAVEENIENKPMQVVPAEHDNSAEGYRKDAFNKEVVAGGIKERLMKIKRVVSVGKKIFENGKEKIFNPICYLAGFKCIYANQKDLDAAQRRKERNKDYSVKPKLVLKKAGRVL